MGFANNDLVQSAIEAQIANEENKEEERLEFNPLQLYFGDDYVVNDKITIHQPSIQDYPGKPPSNGRSHQAGPPAQRV